MRVIKTRFLGRLVLSAALGMSVLSADSAVPLAHFPYLPGGEITQLEEGGRHLFAVTSSSVWGDLDAGGRFLYSRHSDSASWKLVRSGPTPGVTPLRKGAIRFQGSLGARSFFNLEDSKAYFTGNGGATFTLVADLPFQSNVAGIGGLAFAVLDNAVHTSADSGLSWTRMSTLLVADQLIAIDNLLYARGTKIWRSGDSGRTWQEHMEGLPPIAITGYGIYGLYRYGSLLVSSTLEGAYVMASASSPWTPMGSDSRYLRYMFHVGTELFAESNTRFHRYDPGLAAWQEYKPWAYPKPMDMVHLGSLRGIFPFGPRWIVGNKVGLMAYDPGTEDFAWFDAGIHRAAYSAYGALSGYLVAAHRLQLIAVPPDGVPTLLRDFRKPGTGSGNISLVSTEPADSVLWAYSDSTLFRLEKSAGIPSIRDSVRVNPGKYFCQGRDLIGLISIGYSGSIPGNDSVLVRVSRNAGATFRDLPHHLSLPGSSSYPGLEKIFTAYIWNDTAWLWDGNADYHAFDLATGGYRFGENSIPPQVSISGTALPVQALAGGQSMVVKQGNSILHSEDGGLTWNLGTRGISGTLVENSRIQKHAGRLYLPNGDTLYHTEESEFQWSKIDLKALAGASGGVSGALVAREGIYVQRSAEDVVLLAWSEIPASARPFIASPSPGRAVPHPAFRRGKGMMFLRNGLGYSIEGRVVD